MTSLAAALAGTYGRRPDDPVVEVVAGTLVNAQRTLYRSLRRRLADNASDDAVARAHRRDVDRVFDQLATGGQLAW